MDAGYWICAMVDQFQARQEINVDFFYESTHQEIHQKFVAFSQDLMYVMALLDI